MWIVMTMTLQSSSSNEIRKHILKCPTPAVKYSLDIPLIANFSSWAPQWGGGQEQALSPPPTRKKYV